jgi:putative lipoic acid-binding regulatory protein
LEENIVSRLSNNNHYRSVSFHFIAQSREQVDALYAELSSHKRVLMIL